MDLVVDLPDRSRLMSFRFTLRADGRFVMDRLYPTSADGKLYLLDESCRRYNPAARSYNADICPSFDSMQQLLVSLKEVTDVADAGRVLPRSVPAHAGPQSSVIATVPPTGRAISFEPNLYR